MKYWFFFVSFLLLHPSQSSADDAWMEIHPSEDEVREELMVSFRIGHAEDKEPWIANPEHVARFVHFGSDGPKDLTPSLFEGAAPSKVSLGLNERGLHTLVLDTFRAKSVLDADKFNSYIAEEGITAIVSDRAKQAAFNAQGREYYSRHMKALVFNTESEICALANPGLPIGQVLEIVPLGHPYVWQMVGSLDIEVRYLGQPLPGATLHVNPLSDQPLPPLQKTDHRGRASIAIPEGTDWYVHTAWAQPATNLYADVDYLTAFASLYLPEFEKEAETCS